MIASSKKRDCRDGISGYRGLFYISDATNWHKAGPKWPHPRPEVVGAEND